MTKVKILKSLPKSKTGNNIRKKSNVSTFPKKYTELNKENKDKYLSFYDDIKLPTRKNDW